MPVQWTTEVGLGCIQAGLLETLKRTLTTGVRRKDSAEPSQPKGKDDPWRSVCLSHSLSDQATGWYPLCILPKGNQNQGQDKEN